MNTYSVNGKLCDAASATVSVMDHGLLYGDGVFEGLRFYNGKVFRQQAHLERLQASAQALALQLPMSLHDTGHAIEDAVRASGLDDGYIRLVVTRGTGPLGVDPSRCHNPQTIIIVAELSLVDADVRAKGARLIIAATRRLRGDQCDPRVKSLNYLNQVMARLEANAAGADEAVMLNDRGFVAEGTADNIFIEKNGMIATPPLSDGALDGITRGVILAIAKENGIKAVEQSLTPYDLYTADGCFLTGTGAELIPVREITGRQTGSVRSELFGTIEAGFQAVTNPL